MASGEKEKIFNPLAPCGARHQGINQLRLLRNFQSTRPLRGETWGAIAQHTPLPFFNPLAPCGARRPTFYGCPDFRIFNPLAPCGARQPERRIKKRPLNFQSTRPLRGETPRQTAQIGQPEIFNPLAPCGARPMMDGKQHRVDGFSIHSPLAGRDSDISGHSRHREGFQSTRPLRGETLASWILSGSVMVFQSTRPLRGETARRAR